MSPHDICRRLGEVRVKEMFMSLNAAAMKQSLMESRLAAVRSASQVSTRKRNEEWARRFWQSVNGEPPAPCKLFLFEWLRQTKSELLSTFLDAIAVPHQRGLTDADFMKDVPSDKLLEAARAETAREHAELLAQMKAREVADTERLRTEKRMADLLALQPNFHTRLHIVAPEERRKKVFQELRRPAFSVFEQGPLSRLCSYLPYEKVQELAEDPNLEYLKPEVLDKLEEWPGE